MGQSWPDVVTNANTVAEMLDWVRRRTAGRALLGILIGTNGIVVSKDLKLSPRDAIEMLRSELDTIAEALEQLPQEKVTRKAVPRRG